MTGAHTVKLEYKRSFEVNVAPAKTFSFTINVGEPTAPAPAPTTSAPTSGRD